MPTRSGSCGAGCRRSWEKSFVDHARRYERGCLEVKLAPILKCSSWQPGLRKFHTISLPPWRFRQMVSTTTLTRRSVERSFLPTWVKPQLATLVREAPDGSGWLHEIKLDGYRMHARLDAGRVQILTRRGNDWTGKYPAIAKAVGKLPAKTAYLDGELCGLLPDGRAAFNLIQNASDSALIFFLFDLLFLDGEKLMVPPLVDRKIRLEAFLVGAPESLRYNDHQIGKGPAIHGLACQHGLEGIVSKRIDGRYEPDRRTWLKTKCLNREEFVVVGWNDPEGSRHRIGALLLGYYTPDGKLIYAGRAGTGRARRGPVIAVTHPGKFPVTVDAAFQVPATEPELDPLLLNIPLQLLAYHVALKKGCDIDKPRNLAKSVTVE